MLTFLFYMLTCCCNLNPLMACLTTTIQGRGIFDGIFDDLFATRGLGKATELLYSGCSAGGLTAYIHADRVTAVMKERAPAAKVVVVGEEVRRGFGL